MESGSIVGFQADDALLRASLESLAEAVLVIDAGRSIRFYNSAFAVLFALEPNENLVGKSVTEFWRRLARQGEFGTLSEEMAIDERLKRLEMGKASRVERVRPGGTVLQIDSRPLAGGGFVFTYADISPMRLVSERLRRVNRATVVTLANFAEHRDTDTGTHVLRVARMTEEIARILVEQGDFPDALTPAVMEHLATASILHDVGKISVPDKILLKPGSLNEDERSLMQRHSLNGARLLREANLLAEDSLYLTLGIEIALSHHERVDGNGYPHRLKGEDIPVAARIVAVADVYDALCTKRPYKDAWPVERVVSFITGESGRFFDPRVVEAFQTVLARRSTIKTIVWNPAMSVGESRLDDEHMVLIDIINQLYGANERRDNRLLEMVIDELYSYASFHFQHEEDYIAGLGFPGTERHVKLHHGFIRRLTATRQKFLAERQPEIGIEILDFLTSWLRDHIMGEDRRYREFAEWNTFTELPSDLT
ncbi:MAG: bacteriohemerythrin [Rhodospirillales bacterium]|nr:bacteriohemerythrin [Rhodospirillales bacterium]